jgi:uncharacterized protein (TIGR02271 family)
MVNHETLVVASFSSHSDAENAVRDLQTAGFRSDQIGSSYDDYDTEATGTESSTRTAPDERSFWEKMRDFFSGEEHEHTSSASVQSDWSSGLTVPHRYQELIGRGGDLITVQTDDRMAEAQQILTSNHGQLEREFANTYKEQPTSGQDVASGSSERRIQLISEVLRVRKERVQSGEVRLRKEIHTETQNIQVPVTREEIVIERSAVSGENPATAEIGADSEIRVPLSEERVQVDKVPVVREEVRIGKRPVSETQTVSDQVRREELDVEGGDEKVRGSVNKRKRA